MNWTLTEHRFHRFDEDEGPKKHKRYVGANLPPSPTEHELDDYEPEGEWNIDGTGITAEDLLDEGSNQNIVHLARLHPRKVLVGEEE